MKFRAKILQGDKAATGIEVPAEIVAALGSSKRPKVRVTLNGYTYRSSIASMGGKYMLGVSAENRSGAGVAGGDVVDVDLEFDTAPREVTVPPDLTEALNQDPVARRFFEGLSYSHKRWHVLSIEGAKTPETRARRIAKSVSLLKDGRAQG